MVKKLQINLNDLESGLVITEHEITKEKENGLMIDMGEDKKDKYIKTENLGQTSEFKGYITCYTKVEYFEESQQAFAVFAGEIINQRLMGLSNLKDQLDELKD